MIFTSESGELKRFRSDTSSFQQTFKTPLQDLNRFVGTFLSLFQIEEGYVAFEQVVFEPENVIEMLERYSISVEHCYGALIAASGSSEVAELLEETLSDWIDFIFVPTPRLFSIYADHDEWATFFADDPIELARITSALTEARFEAITDWRRQLV